MVVPGVKPEAGMPSPSPIRRVLAGKIHGVEIMIGVAVVPPVAGSRMVEGAVTVVLPSVHGLPWVHFRLVAPLMPRASITAPVEGYTATPHLLVKMPYIVSQRSCPCVSGLRN